MDFISDLSDILIMEFTKIGVNPPNGNNYTIITRYFNLQDKLIESKRRNVKESKELMEKDFGDYYNRSLRQIKNKFKNGKDINAYLSKKAFKPSQKDLLLYDWGIYHLHLNSEFDKDGFVKRSDYLLFFMIDENNVFLIDVTKHKLSDRTEFSQQELLRIVKKNWSFLLEPYKFKEAIALDRKMTDQDYSETRKAGGLALVEIDGEVFGLIGGGITTARTNIRHTAMADNVYELFKDMENRINRGKEHLSKFIYQNGLQQISYSFKLIVEDEKFVVINENTGLKVLESKSLYDMIFCRK